MAPKFYCEACGYKLRIIYANIKIEGPIAIIKCPRCFKEYQKNLSSLAVSTCERDDFLFGISEGCFNTMGNLDKARTAITLAQFISKKVNDDYPGASDKKKKKKKK